MPIIYLTPASVSYLTQFILAFAIAAYLLHLTRRIWRRDTLFLAGAFSFVAGYILLLFLNASLHPNLRFYAMPLEGPAIALTLLFSLQFAYLFPSPLPGKAWEARLVLWLTIFYTLWEMQIALFRFVMIRQGYVEYRPAIADYFLVAGFLWFLIILFRQTVRAPISDWSSLEDCSNLKLWRNLWRPRGRAARTARAFFLFSAMPLLLTVASLLRAYFILPNGVTEATLSLGMLFMLTAFALVYLNYLPETTSFMVKLVGVTLAVSLATLGSVGWIITPAYIAAYQNDHFMAEKQSLRFTPNPIRQAQGKSQGGYDVAAIPFHFDQDLGVDLGLVDTRVALGFDFPFYEQVWDEAYLMRDGAVSFGQALGWQDIRYRYSPLAAIFPLFVDFVNSDALLNESSAGFFAKSTADKLTVTWYRLPEFYSHETRYTFQLTLYPSGVFEIAYDDLPATQNYDIYEGWNTAWLVGLTPGSSDLDPHHIRFMADLPFSGGGNGGIVEDYYLYFRRYLHQLFAPLTYFIIGSSLFILIGFPMLFRLNLVEPLNNLLKGVKRFSAGNLETAVPVAYRDEIGFLTQSFNEMAAEQHDLILNLEARVAERTKVANSLRRAMLAFSKSLDHTAVLDEILAQLKVIISYDSAGLFLQEDDNLRLVKGIGLDSVVIDTRIPINSANRTAKTFQRRQAEIIPDVHADPRWQVLPTGEQIRSSMAAPLLIGPEAIGVLTLDRFELHAFIQEEADILQAFANQAALAIKNAELHRQAQNAAVLEERNRLAQDLHDAVNQTLFTASIMAETIPKVWEKDPERGRQGLEEVRLLTKGALAEMRTLLMELRPQSFSNRPLGQLLRHLTDAISSRARIPIALSVENDGILPLDLQITLYRIAQESFNNIIKHAEATEVSLYLNCQPHQTIMSIQDNGLGFTPTEALPGHIGLKIMRERAEEIGASLVVSSQPGAGTQVEVVWDSEK